MFSTTKCPIIAILIYIGVLVIPINAQDVETQKSKGSAGIRVQYLVQHDGVLYGASPFVKEWMPNITQIVHPLPTYCLLGVSVTDTNTRKCLVFGGIIISPPLLGMDRDKIHWIQVNTLPYPPGSTESLKRCSLKFDHTGGVLFANSNDSHSILPLSDLKIKANFIDQPKYLGYNIAIGDRGKPQLYIQYGDKLTCWTVDEERKWVKGEVYSVNTRQDFYIISSAKPVMLTISGDLYLLSDKSATLVATVDIPRHRRDMASSPAESVSGDAKSTTAPAATTQAGDGEARLFIVNLQKEGKHAMLVWNQGEVKAIDVLDSKKQRVEPFVSAGSVDPNMAKALKAMMASILEGEKNLAIIIANEQKIRNKKRIPSLHETLWENLDP